MRATICTCSGQQRAARAEGVEVAPHAGSAVEQGGGQAQIVGLRVTAEIFGVQGGPCGLIAQVPGAHLLVVRGGIALLLLGQGVQFAFFRSIKVQIKLTSRVNLRAGCRRLRSLPADDAGGLLPFFYRGFIPGLFFLPGGIIRQGGALFCLLCAAFSQLGLVFGLLAAAFGLLDGTDRAHGGSGQSYGRAYGSGCTGCNGHQQSSLCQMVSVWCAPRRR